MNKAKQVCQQIFLYLLLLLSGGFTVYSAILLNRSKDLVAGKEFIDTAARSVDEAYALLEQRDLYAAMVKYGVIALIVCALLIALWYVSHWLLKKRAAALAARPPKVKREKPVKVKPEKAAQPEPAPAAPRESLLAKKLKKLAEQPPREKAPKAPKEPKAAPAPVPSPAPVEPPQPVETPATPAPAPVPTPPKAPSAFRMAPASLDEEPPVTAPTPKAPSAFHAAPAALDGETPAPAAAPQPAPVQIFCANCGTACAADMLFCTNCGAKLLHPKS